MPASLPRPLTGALCALLVAACLAPTAAAPQTPASPGPTRAAPQTTARPSPLTPTPAATQQPGTPSATTTPAVSCQPAVVDRLRDALAAGELVYAYRAEGARRFPGGRREVPFAHEGARDGELLWWRRIEGGGGFHDEAVGNAASTWLRWPLERSWELDTEGEAGLSDPLAEMLELDGWLAQPAEKACLLRATKTEGKSRIAYSLALDGRGRPVGGNEVGRRPDAPTGEGVPAAWQVAYRFTSELPQLPSTPPAALPADDATAIGMLAVNGAPAARVLWRAQAGVADVLAFAAHDAHGFIAWAPDGRLLEAAVLDHQQTAANLLELSLPGRLDDDGDDRLYALAIVLDDRVASLELRTDGRPPRDLAASAPGMLIELGGYLDDWRFRYADGGRVPLPR